MPKAAIPLDTGKLKAQLILEKLRQHPHDAPMELRFSFDAAEIDFQRVHSWLTGTYWSPGIPLERVRKGFDHSTLVVGCYTEAGIQVGVARCLSDTTRFAYISDVFVDEDFRGRGIAREMVQRILSHPDLAGVEFQYLFTQDAHGVYEGIGFEKYPFPERLMYRSQTF